MELYAFLLAGLIVAAFFWHRHRSKKRRREQLLASPLSEAQRKVIADLVPITRRLPAPLRQKLEGKVNLFLDQMTFRGHGGIEVNDEMRLSIAAQACLLIVNSPAWYDTLRNVLIYPSTIRTSRNTQDGHVVQEQDFPMAGESWARGPVVLSWDHALQGGLDDRDGYNLVIHEFAHQLDSLTGHTNGIPVLRRGQAYAGWEKAMLEAFNDHVERVERGQDTVIDPYGATNHQEFFAEAIVTFFEKPRSLRSKEPALYSQLSQLLALDPAEWD
ncbi:MAG: M90 family metallopeptidase [Erythrobacter sp.]